MENKSWTFLIESDSCLRTPWACYDKDKKKSKINIETSKCVISQAGICQRPAPSDNKCASRHPLDSNSLHRLAEQRDRECCLNNSWGEKPSEAPTADQPTNPLSSPFSSPLSSPLLEPHFHHLLRQESLMGFRGKYQSKGLRLLLSCLPFCCKRQLCHPVCSHTWSKDQLCTVTVKTTIWETTTQCEQRSAENLSHLLFL